MPDDKLKILYDNLIGTGKITQKEMGDFPTFSKLMSDSTNVRTFYDNITSSGIVSQQETGDFDTFYKYIKPQEPEFDFQSSFDKIDSLKTDVDKRIGDYVLASPVPDETGTYQYKSPESLRNDDTYQNLERQKQYLTNAKDLVKSAQKFSESQDEGNFQQFLSGLSSPLAKDFFTAGLMEMGRNLDVVGVARKSAEGQELTPEEQAMLTAYGTMQTLTSQPGSLPYTFGQNLAMQVPYMVQFAATGGIGTAAEGGANALLNVTKASLPKLMKEAGYVATMKQIGKELPGLAIKGAAQTPFMPMTYSIMGEKMIGEVDAEGNVTNQPTLSEGMWKGLAQAYPEVLTESMGAHIMGSFGAAGKSIGKKIPANITRLLTPAEKARKAVAFGNFTEEFSEEMMNNVLTPMLDPDTDFADVWTGQNILTTALTIATTGGAFYASNQAFKAVDEQSLRGKYLSGLPKDVRTNVIGSMKSDNPTEVSQKLTDIISKSGLQPEQAKGILDYAWAESMRKGMAESLFEQNKEIQTRQIEKDMRNQIAPFVYKDGETLFQVLDNQGNVFWVKDGEINVNQEDQSWTIGKKPLIVVPMEGGEPRMMAVTDVSSVRTSKVSDKINESIAQFQQQAEVEKTVTEAAEIVETEKAESITPDLKTGDFARFGERDIVINQVSGSAIDAQYTDTEEPVVIPPAEFGNIKKIDNPTTGQVPGQQTGQPAPQADNSKTLTAKVGKNEVKVKFTPDAQDNTLFTSDNSFSQESDANRVIKSLSDRYSKLEFTAVDLNTDPFSDNKFVIQAKPKQSGNIPAKAETELPESQPITPEIPAVSGNVEPLKPQTNEQIQQAGQEIAQVPEEVQQEKQGQEELLTPQEVEPIVTPDQAEVVPEVETPFDYSQLFGEDTPQAQPENEIDAEREAKYQASSFDKDWAATHKIAIEKLVADYKKAEQIKSDWESRKYKSNKGVVDVNLKGDDYEQGTTTIGAANERRRDRAIKSAKDDMATAINDLKQIGLSDAEIKQLTQGEVVSQTAIPETPTAQAQPEAQLQSNYDRFTADLGLTESFDQIEGDAMTGKIGDADIVVAKDGDRITLESIRVPLKKRQKGQANAAMKAITEKADELGLDITLRAVPEPSSDMSPQQLRDWYRKFGFSFIGNNGLRVANEDNQDSPDKTNGVKPVTKSSEHVPDAGKMIPVPETPQKGGKKESKTTEKPNVFEISEKEFQKEYKGVKDKSNIPVSYHRMIRDYFEGRKWDSAKQLSEDFMRNLDKVHPDALSYYIIGYDYALEITPEYIARDPLLLKIRDRLLNFKDEGLGYVREYLSKPFAQVPEIRPQTQTEKWPWEMTRDEFTEEWLRVSTSMIPWRSGKSHEKAKAEAPSIHKEHIQQALSEGKPVPPEVLEDYPELKPKETPQPVSVSNQPKKSQTPPDEFVGDKLNPPTVSSLDLNTEMRGHNGYLYIQDRAFNQHKIYYYDGSFYLMTQRRKLDKTFHKSGLYTHHINPILEQIVGALPKQNAKWDDFNKVELRNNQDKIVKTYETITVDEVPFPEDDEETKPTKPEKEANVPEPKVKNLDKKKRAVPKRIKDVMRDPESFEESVLQFLLDGGRFNADDFVRYSGFKKGSTEYRIVSLFGLKGKGTSFDDFGESNPTFGEEEKGAMDMINRITEILLQHTSKWSITKRLEAIQNPQMPEDMIDPDWTPEDVDVESVSISTTFALTDDGDINTILEAYAGEDGVDWQRLSDEVENDPGTFTQFPYGLNSKQFDKLKKVVSDELKKQTGSGAQVSATPGESKGDNRTPGTPADAAGAARQDNEKKEKREPGDRIGSEPINRPAVRGTSGGGRPGLTYATKDNIPEPTGFIKVGDYPLLDKDQVFAVNLAISRFKNNGKAFLLADGTGVGKTLEILATADQYAKQFGGKVLIITENQQIIDNNFTRDANNAGIDISKFELGTYHGLRSGNVGKGKYGLVIYDEAHNLKNAESGKRTAAENVDAEHEMYATATPMDTPAGSSYFIAKVTNLPVERVWEMMGFTVKKEFDQETQKYITRITLKEGTDANAIRKNITKIRNNMIEQGAMLRREYPFYGEFRSVNIPVTDQVRSEEEEIASYWDDMEDAARNDDGGINPKKLMLIRGQRSNEFSRWNEQNKAEYVLRQAIQDVKDGKKVVIIAEGINNTRIKGLNKEVPGIITEVVKGLEKAGLRVAKIYGNNNKSVENNKFQSNNVDVVVGTPLSAAVGIDLDDQIGDSPRVLYMVTPNYSGNLFQQILGRISRRNTKSPSEAVLLYNNTESDSRRRQIVDKKLGILTAIQNGVLDEDIDVDGRIDTYKVQNEKGNYHIKPISDKAFVVTGDTWSIKGQLKAAGGSWNQKYTGWTFPNSKLAAVKDIVNNAQAEQIPVQSDQEKKIEAINRKYDNEIFTLKKQLLPYSVRMQREVAVQKQFGKNDFAGDIFGKQLQDELRKVKEEYESHNQKINDKIKQLEKDRDAEIKLAEGQEDLRFQLQPEETISDNLVALHNINDGDIRNVNKLGGMVAPSIAILQKETPYTDFGNITLIADKKTVDPNQSSVKVFKGDVYSPTVPRPKWYVDTKKHKAWVNKIMHKIYSDYQQLASRVQNIIDDFGSFGKSLSNTDRVSLKEGVYDDMKVVYLIEHDIPVPIPTKGYPVKLGFNWYVDSLSPEHEKRAKGLVSRYDQEGEATTRDVKENTMDELRDLAGDIVYDETIKLYGNKPNLPKDFAENEAKERVEKVKERIIVDYFVTSLQEYLSGRQQPDNGKINESIEKTFKGKVDKNEYNEWLTDKIDEFRGAKYFEQGNKKVPYTLENLIDAVSGQTRGKEKGMTFGMNRAKSYAIKQLKSVDAMHKAKKDLVTKERMTEIEQELQTEYFKLADRIKYKYSDQWGKLDDFGKSLADYFKGASPQSALQRNGFTPDRYNAEMFQDFADKLADSPVDYFEAKMQRGVDLSEFKYAVVPKDTEKDIIDILKSNGIKIKKYATPEERSQLVDDIASKDSNVRFQLQPSADIFYSNSTKAIESIKQEKATPEQWKAMLLNNGAKEAELEWMGWDEFVQGKRSFSKNELSDWMNANRVEVREVVKGEGETNEPFEGWSDEAVREYYVDYFQEEPEGLNRDGMINQLLDAEDNGMNPDDEGTTKYRDYQLPGGENYRELLLTMPKTTGRWDVVYPNGTVYNTVDTKEEAENVAKLVSKVQGENFTVKKEVRVDFKSSHFDQPNILAHVRFNERTDADGNRVLFIEEIQSDWAQKGKKEGFRATDNKSIAASLRKEKDNFYTKLSKHEDDQVEYGLSQFESGKIDRTQLNKILLANGYSEFDIKSAVEKNKVPPMPFPKTDQWVGLAMKRMIRWAADNGYDKIAWTTGEQQADRYDLRKQVKSIYWVKNNDGTFDVQAQLVTDRYVDGQTHTERNLDFSKIQDVFGKQVADKIKEDSEEYPELEEDSFDTDELEIGGEGMKAFYDNIIPNWVNKFGKKYGVKVGETIIFGKEYETDNFVPAQEEFTVPSFDLTDQLRETAQQGLPMFRLETNPILSKDADFMGDIVFGKKYQYFLAFHENLAKMAQRVAEQTGTKIFVVKSAGELPAKLRDAVKRKNDQGNFAPALFYDKNGEKEVWIISNQTRSTSDAGKSLLHEVVAHHGLRQLFGQRYDDILRQVWKQMSDDDKIDRFRTYLAGNRDVFDRMSREDKLKLINNINESQRFLLADEWLAKQSETLGDKTPTWLRKIFSQIRQMLRDVFGVNLKFTDNDLKAMFTASRENLATQAQNKPVTGKFAGEVIFDKSLLRQQIIGEQGAQRLVDAGLAVDSILNLQIAKDMESSGKSEKEIWLATGWQKGKEGKWRMEVPDFNLKVTLNKDGKRNQVSDLKDIVDNNSYFVAYPKLKDVVVFLDINPTNTLPGGSFTPTWIEAQKYQVPDEIQVRASDIEQAKSILSHEIQHAIQYEEGFAKGGNKRVVNEAEFKENKIKHLNNLISDLESRLPAVNERWIDDMHDPIVESVEKIKDRIRNIKNSDVSYEAYRSLAGEVEARNAQTRLTFDDLRRAETMLSESEDVAREDQIVLMDRVKNALDLTPEMNILDEIKNNPKSDLKNHKLIGDVNFDIMHRYLNGESIKDIATSYNITHEATRVRIRRMENDILPKIWASRNLNIRFNLTPEVPQTETEAFDETNPDIRFQLTPEQVKGLNYEKKLPDNYLFAEAVRNTKGAKITEDGLLIDLVRYQQEEQGGDMSVRTGVFYLPVGSQQEKYYRGSKTNYGGTVKIEGTTLIRRPIFVKGATGGKAPEMAYDQIKGKGAYQKMRDYILQNVIGYGFKKVQPEELADILTSYKDGSDYDENYDQAYEILRVSTKGNTLAYAVQENIVAHAAREAGYDSVIGYSLKKDGSPFISEVFDVREVTYPMADEESDIHERFLNNPYIRFSLQPPPPGLTEPYNPDELQPRDMFNTDNTFETKFNHAVEKVFDSMLAVKFVEDEVERRGGKFNAHSRPYREENMARSRAQAEKEKFDQTIVMPYEKVLAEIQKSTGLSYRDIWIYIVSKHALERNRDLGGESGVASGSIDGVKLTNDVARWYIEHFEDEINKYDGDLLQKLWDARNKVTRFTLDKYLASGMISREVYDKLTDPVNGWQHYVPYRGWKDNLNELFDYQSEGLSDAYNPMKKAEGRLSEADDPTVYMISMGHTAILAGAKNDYKRQMANLILLNPDIADAKDLFWFKRVYRILDDNGNIVDEMPQDQLPGLYIEKRDNGKITVVGSGVSGVRAKLKKAGGVWDFARRGYTFEPEREADLRMEFSIKPGTVTTKVTDIHQSRKPIYLAKQHEVDVWIRGERAIMVFADPKVAHALNRNNFYASSLTQDKYFQNIVGTPTRYLAQVLTSKNPAFWPVNMTRDIGYAWAWHAINSDQNAAEFLKNIPAAIKASHRYLKGHTEHLKQKNIGTLNEVDKMYLRWKEAGGETSYFRLLDIEKLRRNVDHDLKVMMGELSLAGKMNENVIQKAGEWLGIYSQLSENISRFATYMTAYQQYRKKGIEDEEAHKRAVADSKNVTVNFDKYGRVTPLLKAFYLFIGPNLGGVYNMGKLAAKHKTAFLKGIAAFMVMGLASAEITRLLSPPDDDDPNKREYDTLNDFIKGNYLVLPNPAWWFTDTANESFITIPMPQGFRAFFNMGAQVSQVIHGQKTIGQALVSSSTGIADAFMPVSMNFTAVGEQGLEWKTAVRPVTPDLIKPVFDAFVWNEDFAGRMITREPFTQAMEQRLPEFTEANRYNNPYIVTASKWLNKLGGGDDLRSATFEIGDDGQIRYNGFNRPFDVNPARIEYLIEQYTGGVGTELNNTVKTLTSAVQKATGDEEAVIDSRNIPVLRRFYRTASNESAFRKWNELKKEVDNHFYYMASYKKNKQFDEYKELRSNTYMQAMKRLVDRVEKQAGRIEEVVDWKQQNEESAQKYFEQMEQMYRDALKQAQELKKQQQK